MIIPLGLRRYFRKKLDRFFGNAYALRVQDRQGRHEARARRIAERKAARLASSRWGVSYTVFDGEELLEASIRSIRSEVDYINIVYQRVSWYGKPASPQLEEVLERLRAKKLVDECIEYTVDEKLKPTENEITKRNVGLRHALAAGCTHFMTMDCDEFYFTRELASAKQYIIDNYITHSYVTQVCHGETPTTILPFAPHICLLSFFGEIASGSVLKHNPHIPCKVDPTRKLSHFWGAKYWVFDNSLKMHHMSYVRNNLLQKIENSSYYDGEKRMPCPDCGTMEHYAVPDYFNIAEALDAAAESGTDRPDRP